MGLCDVSREDKRGGDRAPPVCVLLGSLSQRSTRPPAGAQDVLMQEGRLSFDPYSTSVGCTQFLSPF